MRPAQTIGNASGFSPQPPGASASPRHRPSLGPGFQRTWLPISPDRQTWLWTALAALMACLFPITNPQPFLDELTSWSMATRDFGSMLKTAQHHDLALLPFYVILHGWVQLFGDSALAIRMPSALAMAGAAACIALSGQRLFGRRAGVTAGMLFAMVPEVAHFGMEARPYAMVMCATAASVLLLLRALERRTGTWRWVAYGASVMLMGLFQSVALTSLMAHVALVALRAGNDRKTAMAFGRAVLGGLLATAPLALGALQQASTNIGWIPHPSVRDLIATLQYLYSSPVLYGGVLVLGMLAWHQTVRVGLRETAVQPLVHPSGPHPESSSLRRKADPDQEESRSAMPTAGIPDARQQRVERLGHRQSLLFVTLLAVGPLLAVWLLSQGQVSFFFFRYLLFTLIGWVLLAGAGLAVDRSYTAVIAVVVGLAVLALPDALDKRGEFAHSWVGIDYRHVAQTIVKQYQPGDAVIYARNGIAYHRRYDLGTAFYLPRDFRIRDVFQSQPARLRNELADSSECADPATCLRDAAAKRIWLIATPISGNELAGLTDTQQLALYKSYRVRRVTHRQGVNLALMDRMTAKEIAPPGTGRPGPDRRASRAPSGATVPGHPPATRSGTGGAPSTSTPQNRATEPARHNH